MNVTLDQTRGDQTTIELLAWGIARKPRRQRRDAAVGDADVEALAVATGNARVAQDEIEAHVRSATVLLRRGPDMRLRSPGRRLAPWRCRRARPCPTPAHNRDRRWSRPAPPVD